MIHTALSSSGGGGGWESVCPGLLVALLAVSSSSDVCGHREHGAAAGRVSEPRQGCRQRSCCCHQQLRAVKKHELGRGSLGFGVCGCAAASGSCLFWEEELRCSCTPAPREALRSMSYLPPTVKYLPQSVGFQSQTLL